MSRSIHWATHIPTLKDLWGHDCKKWAWPAFGCNVGQTDPIVMTLKLDMSCHLLNVNTKFQIGTSKHVEKSPENLDGRTLPAKYGRFFKRAYKNSR